MAVLSAHLCRANSNPLRPRRRVTWIKTKMEGVESGHYNAHRPSKLGLSCKANKCSDAGTGDLGVLTANETSPCLGDAGSSRPRLMTSQVQVSKYSRA